MLNGGGVTPETSTNAKGDGKLFTDVPKRGKAGRVCPSPRTTHAIKTVSKKEA